MVSLGGSVFECRQNIAFFEERVILKNFLMGSSCTEQTQDIRYTHARSANAWPPAAFARIDGDPVQLIGLHGSVPIQMSLWEV